MLDHSEVSILMCEMQNMFIDTIEREGQAFPTLVIMNKESSINVDDLLDNYDCIFSISYSPETHDAYITLVTVRGSNEKDDEAFLEIIKEISLKYSPDSIGYISQSLYKPMKREEFEKTTTDMLNLDPDAIRVLHNCFYTKKDKQDGYLMVTPYQVSETKDSEAKEPSFIFDDVNDPNYTRFTVITFEKPWEKATPELRTRIPNPYL